MKKSDAIYDEITQQVGFIFDEILNLINQSRQEPRVVDAKIKEIWTDFYDGLICFLDQKKLNRNVLRKPYIQHSEKCFLKHRENYERNTENAYLIKLRPKTQFIDPPQRQILTTEERIKLGRLHFHINAELKTYWRSRTVDTKTPQQLWGNFYLSLIYCSGCNDLSQLTAIGNTLIDEMQQSRTSLCSKLYRADYKKITNPLVLHYRTQHRYYGNQIEEKNIYQWRHVWFNPYAQMFMEGIKRQGVLAQNPRCVIEAIIAVFDVISVQVDVSEQIQELKKILRCSDQALIDMGALKTFKHVNLGLEIHPDLSLDMCLSEVLQNRLKTVSLTPQDQKAAWFKEQALTKDDAFTSSSQRPSLQTEVAQLEMITAHQQLKEIPFELMLFERDEEKSKQNKKRQRKSESIKLMRWKHIQKSLQKKKTAVHSKEQNLVEAQLRLLGWIFDLKEKNNKVSSIERYLSSMAKDYLFHIYMYEDAIETMNTQDYEELYESILNGIDDRDEIQRTSKPNMRQGRAQYAFGRLKSFHTFCIQKYGTPQVSNFKYNTFQRVQLCHAKLVSPQIFNQLKQKLMLKINACSTLQEQEYMQQLQLMYLLAYRLGLRLNEIRGLTFAEIICPELIWKNSQHNQDIQIRITLKNNVYRRLKSQNANRQLDLNAVLLKDEMEFIKQYLNTYFSHINLIQPIDKRLVFSSKGEILSELYITQMTQILFNEIIGKDHNYSFHSFRHSAANHLAIAWCGSKEMVMTYTDYTWNHAKLMRKYLFGECAIEHEGVIQHKWRLLADWMGHSSIEQTASHYLHTLDLLAIDRIYNTPCLVHHSLVNTLLGEQQTKDEIDLRQYIQNNKGFDFYHQSLALKKLQPFPIIKTQSDMTASSYEIIRCYIERSEYKEHIWLQRCIWLAAKWKSPKLSKLKWEQNSTESMDEQYLLEFYDDALKRNFDPKTLVLFTELEQPLKAKALSALAILIQHTKLRKNYIHFQYRFDENNKPKMKWIMGDFIIGIQQLLPDNVKLKTDNYPVNIKQKSREIKVSFRDGNEKNITLCVVFGLMLEAIKNDYLWEIA